MKPSGILETILYAEDLNAAERFYAEILGLEKISRESPVCVAGAAVLAD